MVYLLLCALCAYLYLFGAFLVGYLRGHEPNVLMTALMSVFWPLIPAYFLIVFIALPVLLRLTIKLPRQLIHRYPLFPNLSIDLKDKNTKS